MPAPGAYATRHPDMLLLHVLRPEPAEDYEVITSFVIPSTVTVVGPESNISLLESMLTTSIRIDGARSTIREFADLNVSDPLVRLESFSQYEVHVEIREVRTEDTYTVALEPSLDDPSLWEIVPASISVLVEGPKSLMAEFDPSNLYFTMDTSILSPGSQQVTPEILGMVEPFSIAGVEPETVQVLFRSASP